jgi:hypothetical protein
MADPRNLGMTATQAACAAAILVLLAQPAPAHAPGLHHARVTTDDAALLNVVSADFFDRDGSGDASPGDEVRLRFRRSLAFERTVALDNLPFLAPDDDWGVGAIVHFDASGDREEARVVLGREPLLHLYNTYRPGTSGRCVSLLRAKTGLVPILVAPADRRAFVGDQFPDTQRLHAWYGQLHAHTSFSDGEMEPHDAYQRARERGLDFYSVTDHLEQLTARTWERSRTDADAANVPGTFVALYGYEWGGFPTFRGWMNHVNIVGTDRRLSLTSSLSLRSFYRGVLTLPEASVVAQFNHPGMRKPVIGGNDWNGFDYQSDADLRVKLMDVATTRDAAEDNREAMGFIPALDQGWHLGPKGEEDNHHANWVHSRRRTGVWVPQLTRSDLLSGLSRMATFYTDDPEASIKLRADGQWLMGSTLYGAGHHSLEIEVEHRLHPVAVTRVELVSRGGVVVDSRSGGLTPAHVAFEVVPDSDTYYFARVTLQDESTRLISAPIFIDR